MALHGTVLVVDDVPGAFCERVLASYRARTGDGFSIALSGGSTARECYERLAAKASTAIDWWNVDIYWGDERCVPHDDTASNYRLAREALLDRVGAANATHLMRCTEGPDPYQLLLGEVGQLDLIHLGLGPDGHTASLFPGSPAVDADPGRLVVMNEDPLGGNPHPRMTLTFAGIARAKLALVTVMGEEKADALAACATADELPATRITSEEVVWLVDPNAASKLPEELRTGR